MEVTLKFHGIFKQYLSVAQRLTQPFIPLRSVKRISVKGLKVKLSPNNGCGALKQLKLFPKKGSKSFFMAPVILHDNTTKTNVSGMDNEFFFSYLLLFLFCHSAPKLSVITCCATRYLTTINCFRQSILFWKKIYTIVTSELQGLNNKGTN